ncbi:hypothetical protein ACH5RR_008286, partial [Cinchona calisaya]
HIRVSLDVRTPLIRLLKMGLDDKNGLTGSNCPLQTQSKNSKRKRNLDKSNLQNSRGTQVEAIVKEKDTSESSKGREVVSVMSPNSDRREYLIINQLDGGCRKGEFQSNHFAKESYWATFREAKKSLDSGNHEKTPAPNLALQLVSHKPLILKSSKLNVSSSKEQAIANENFLVDVQVQGIPKLSFGNLNKGSVFPRGKFVKKMSTGKNWKLVQCLGLSGCSPNLNSPTPITSSNKRHLQHSTNSEATEEEIP